jgi:Carboxypeptidase regulatory-like domain
MTKLSGLGKFAVAMVVVSGITFAYGVNTNGRIKGTITDPGGAVVTGAQITATNDATGVKYQTTSGADGVYLFPELPIGSYTVTAAATSFKGFTATGIVLNIDQEYVENIKLEVGSKNEVVEVSASAVQVNTTDMELSNVVNSAQMVELPLINRTFTGLELTLPGVQASSDRFTSNYSVSGAQTQQSAYLINGADSNDIALNTLVIAPNLDAIDQFNLIEGPLNAEYDRNSGGIVSATVKSGTNRFHGDGFWFYRDTFLNTADFFHHNIVTGEPSVATFHQNIPGGTIGGPILKNKLFIFGGYQGTRQVVPQSGGNVQVFSQGNLGGDFSADLTGANQNLTFSTNPIPGTVNIPGCSAGEAWADCLTPLGGQVPVSAFNSTALALVKKYVPAANNGLYGYAFNPTTTTSIDQYMGRVDFPLNTTNQLMFVGIYQKENVSDVLPFTGATIPGFGDLDLQTIQQYTFDYIHQFSPSMVNDFAGHYTRFNFQAVIPQNIVPPGSLGFNINPQDAAAASVPTMAISGFFTLGFSTNGPQPRIDQVYQLDDNLSKVVGNHSLKFGYDGRKFSVSNPFFANNSGSYAFNTTSSAFSTGDPSLDFLLGIPATYAQGSGATIQAYAFLNYLYAQDTWKTTDALTLSYGLGYSIDTPLHNLQYGGEGIACLIPSQTSSIFSTAPLGINYPGDKGCTNAGQAYTRYTELGPRIGFAWAPNLGRISDGNSRKFALRGGFGIYYNRTEEESALQTLETPPFGLSSGGVADYGGLAPQFANPWADLDTGATNPNKFPYAFPTKGQTIDYTTLEPMDISTYGHDFRAPYSENFQLSLEREFPARTIARLSYVGALSRHNQITYEGNYETAAGQAACAADPVCITNRNYQSYFYPEHTIAGSIDPNTGIPGFVSVGTVGSGSAGSYHSMQASVEKAMTHGLTFQLSYTYSHALDGGSSFENSGFGESGQRGYNQFFKYLNYGDSAYDVRHRMVFAPIYIVPQFGGSDFSVKNLALAGWEISGIETLASGFPYDVSYAGTTSRSLWCSAGFNFYACPDVPVQIAAIQKEDPRVRNPATGLSTWFNPKASFSAEPIGEFGNTHRNPAHGPGINNTNVIVGKNFILSREHGIRLQVRIESDNVFNHTQFANPTSTFGSGSFGLISAVNTTTPSRQSQLAAKIYF